MLHLHDHSCWALAHLFLLALKRSGPSKEGYKLTHVQLAVSMRTHTHTHTQNLYTDKLIKHIQFQYVHTILRRTVAGTQNAYLLRATVFNYVKSLVRTQLRTAA